jgi:hypothetical protein
MDNITRLEHAVLDVLASQIGNPALARQLASARVVSRENTGAGFYTTFSVDAEERLDGLNSPIGNVGAGIDGLELGMGFVLWVEAGVVQELEGCSYEEDTSGIDFERVGFRDVVAHRLGAGSDSGL